MPYHPLLERQFKKLGIYDSTTPPDTLLWKALLERVSAYYTQTDHDRYRMERSMVIASDEIEQEIEQRKHIEHDLRLANQNLSDAYQWMLERLVHLKTQMDQGASYQQLARELDLVLRWLNAHRPQN